MEEHYNTKEALEAQYNYCCQKGIPNFAPAFDGRCFHCGKDIYKLYTSPNGYQTGISVERAGRAVITGCPHCNYSFVD